MSALVGNDVVDLLDPDNLRSFQRPGYVERVCAERERDLLRAAADPGRVFWSLFAAKEAAYKLLVKLGDDPGFRHRELEVAPDLGSVSFRGRRVAIEICASDEAVHAVARARSAKPRAALRRAGGDPSGDARRLLAELVAPLAGCDAGEVAVERAPSPEAWDRLAPPRVVCASRAVPLDVSLSHDGRFVAAAAAALPV